MFLLHPLVSGGQCHLIHLTIHEVILAQFSLYVHTGGLRDAPLDIWGGGGARVFVACKLFFYLRRENTLFFGDQPKTIFFNVLPTKLNFFFCRMLSLLCTLTLGGFSGQHIFHKFRQQTLSKRLETTKARKCETTKVRNNERAKVRNNESTKLRKSDAKQRKSDAKQRRWKQRNSERAMRNHESAKRNNKTAKQRHCETTKGRCETATLRNNERANLRKGDAKERDFKEILIFETAKQRKGEMALSGHHTVMIISNLKKHFGLYSLNKDI